MEYFLKPIKFIVLFTLLFAVFTLNRQKQINKYLITILVICFVTELINSVLRFNGENVSLSTTISIIIHHSFWLLLLSNFISFKNIFNVLFTFFIICSIVNLVYGEGLSHFNFITFITGAFIYIIIFVYESFYQLRKENFPFFLSNDYLLLSAPVIFFFGLSFMFGFKSKEVTSNIVFGEVKLYDIIIYFVNIIYYSLINIYIYREKKLANA